MCHAAPAALFNLQLPVFATCADLLSDSVHNMAAAAATGPMAACLQQLAGLPPPDLSLPALEPVKNRETYRIRPEGELEEVR